ncbi:MAG: cytochrome c-type biogenesis protein CcmH [Acidobacteriota bacterium]
MSPPSIGIRARLLGVAITVVSTFCLASAQNAVTDPPPTSPVPITESSEAMKVTTAIQCFCGTCVNQSLHDCTCGTAAKARRDVAAALVRGETPDAVIAGFIAEHGPQVLIVPRRAGWNLIGWAMPFAVSAAGLIALLLLLLSWRRRSNEAAAADAAGRPVTAKETVYRRQLEKDLEEII